MSTLAPTFVPRAERRPRRLARDLRVLARSLLWLVLGSAAAIAVALTAPMPFGGRALTVMSGSMEPAVQTGDVVVMRSVSPLALRLGDVVTFRDPHNGRRLITHRVRDIRIGGGEARLVTKGDANNTAEEWVVPADGTVGLVTFRLPKLGYALHWLGHPFARIAVVVLPALLLAAHELRRIWRTREEGDGAAA